ncbi:MAG: hypothetical protein WKF82_11035 [Nocardioidaceae bacterium]
MPKRRLPDPQRGIRRALNERLIGREVGVGDGVEGQTHPAPPVFRIDHRGNCAGLGLVHGLEVVQRVLATLPDDDTVGEVDAVALGVGVPAPLQPT